MNHSLINSLLTEADELEMKIKRCESIIDNCDERFITIQINRFRHLKLNHYRHRLNTVKIELNKLIITS